MVRIPIPRAEEMDPGIWPEHLVTAAVSPLLDQVPQLLYRSAVPSFQVYEYISGAVVDTAYPKGTRVPDQVLRDVVRLLRRLAEGPRDALPELPDSWPPGDTAAFGRLLQSVTAGVVGRFRESHARLFSALGIPPEPLRAVTGQWDTFSRRPFRLVHSDIHRKNMILREDGRVCFLDWELALWGDPVYELAVHLHKMGYQPDEAEVVTHTWADSMPASLIRGWQVDLKAYLRHERTKSAVVDSVRYAQLFAQGNRTPEQEDTLVTSLTEKLNRAGRIWGWARPLTAEQVRQVLTGPANPGDLSVV